MNVEHANEKVLSTIEFLSIRGERKTLTGHSDNRAVQAVRAEAIHNLEDFQCLICLDVQEKILQTRCCDAILCAACYLNIQPPKRCPNDSAPFSGQVVRDLKLASRLVSSQIDRLASHFAGIPADVSSDDLDKCQKQKNALRQLQVKGSTMPPGQKPPDDTPVHGAAGPDAVQGAAHDNPGGSQIRVADGMTIINGRIIKGKNIVIQNGRLVSGQNLQVTSIPTAVDTRQGYHFLAAAVSTLDVYVRRGNLVIGAATPDKQDMIYVFAQGRPELNDRVLHIDSGDNVLVRLPAAFNENIHLRAVMGNISTAADYRIKSGGSIDADMGNIDIKVDTFLVEPTGRSDMGRTWMNLPGGQVEWERARLRIRARMGNVSVTS